MNAVTAERRVSRCQGCQATGLSAAIAALALVACSSQMAYKDARPLGAGNSRFLAATQIHTFTPRRGDSLPYPEIAIALRQGLSDRLDVGGSVAALFLGRELSSFALEASAQRHIYRAPGGWLDIALGAGAAYRVTATADTAFESVQASVPVIVGFNLGRHHLAVSSHVSWQRWYSEGTDPLDLAAFGSSLGFTWQISQRIALHPELSWARTSVDYNDQGEAYLGHLGIALIVGRSEP